MKNLSQNTIILLSLLGVALVGGGITWALSSSGNSNDQFQRRFKDATFMNQQTQRGFNRNDVATPQGNLEQGEARQNMDGDCLEGSFDDIPVGTLNQAEQEGILLMREEEKLARDVYLALYDLWGQNTFLNISNSEQQHMDRMEDLINRYNLTDPVVSDTRGEFTNPMFDELYDSLVAQGSASLTSALVVGATIEDLDIKDLAGLINETDKEDLILVYENLKSGSENHLRAFVRVLERQGESYTAQYISDAEFTSILETENGGAEGQHSGRGRNR